MKTIRQIATLIFALLVTNLCGQYMETFPIANKGILSGCVGTEASCTSDFTGVDWTVNGDFTGMDSNDFVATDGNVLLFSDVDGEICYESPVLDISNVVGNFSFSVLVLWENHDMEDYIDVEYQIDGGAWNQIPNVAGGGIHTVDFNTASNSGSLTIGENGLSGTSTVSIRVCVNINLFEPFEFASIDNISVPEAGAVILPVSWADFSVRARSEGNQLTWTTYSEVNNERFEIEKSVDNMLNFREVGSVDGVGNSTKISRYEFLDREISGPTSYYRIKQVDLDGNFEYSEIVVVKKELKHKKRFTPNPFSSQILISMNQQDLIEDTSIRMYDNQSRLVLEKEITSLNLNDPLDTAHLNAGLYSIQYGNSEVVRLVKF